ncbi:MAG: PQQ-binding-like beta-propeller repeat protein [Bacteroidales bacterium]|nr:PQQ-binding-like beta-propeller repeat protein [Bacteroidales bacterium]
MKLTVLHLIITSLALAFFFDSGAQSLLGEDIHSPDSFFEAMETNRQWPSYRGFFASGFLDDAHLPDSFHIESSYQVKWNIPVPGLGLSCPVIWDKRVFITTAVSEEDREGYLPGMYGDITPINDSSEHVWKVLCIDKGSGRLVWEQDACQGIPKVKRHPKSSHANTTIATDGIHVIAFFGSEGLYCYNVEGKLLWKRDFGLIKSAWNVVESAEWEFSSSPLIFQDKVIIQADALNTAFVAVLDLQSGATVWKQQRDEISTWCTPNLYFEGSSPRVVLNGFKHRGAYDLHTGEEIWRMSGGGDIPVPSPIIWKDLIFFNSAHGSLAPLMAVKNSARGEIPYPPREDSPGEDFAWYYNRQGAYMSSVLVYDSLLYRLRWNGNLSCFDARTGEIIYRETVNPASFIASPVASDGKLYLVSEDGDLYIVKAGKEYELLKKIPLGEVSLVTPGITDGMLIFRTASRLIAISK